jgi:hypothetical protein
VVARERGGRTLPVVVSKEADAVPFIRQHVAPGTVLAAAGIRANLVASERLVGARFVV